MNPQNISIPVSQSLPSFLAASGEAALRTFLDTYKYSGKTKEA